MMEVEGWKRSRRKVLRSDQISDFCRHVGAMCGAGVPLAFAMEILQKGNEHRKIRDIYGELQRLMEQGSSFSSALEKTGAFPEHLLNMFRAAEAGGHLEETAKRMAIYYRKEHRIKNQMRTAALYPKILGIVSMFVVLTVFLVVMPTVEPLFREMELPMLTRLLFAVSEFVIGRWYICVSILLDLYLLVHILLKYKKVRICYDHLKLNLPFIGKQLRVIYTARFARSESSLYGSGLPMVESLEIAGRTIGNAYLETQFENVAAMVQGGKSLNSAIETVDGFDQRLAPAIYVGEETGKLDEMMENLAESYEYDAEMAMNRLVAVAEPMMIVIMGAVIGCILLGIMMPIWSMYEYIA